MMQILQNLYLSQQHCIQYTQTSIYCILYVPQSTGFDSLVIVLNVHQVIGLFFYCTVSGDNL